MIPKITGNLLPALLTPTQLQRALAARVRDRRLDRGWSRPQLAERSGVSEGTIKGFERTGQITLKRLLMLARALDALDPFTQLFAAPGATSLDELEARQRRRQRGTRRR